MDEDWPEAGWTEESAGTRYSSHTPAGMEEAVLEARTLYSGTLGRLPGTEPRPVQSGRCTGGWQGAEQKQRAEWVQHALPHGKISCTSQALAKLSQIINKCLRNGHNKWPENTLSKLSESMFENYVFKTKRKIVITVWLAWIITFEEQKTKHIWHKIITMFLPYLVLFALSPGRFLILGTIVMV